MDVGEGTFVIDRRGQVWEDRGGTLVYLVLETFTNDSREVFYHSTLLLYSEVSGYAAGEQTHEFERQAQPWEETDRSRLA